MGTIRIGLIVVVGLSVAGCGAYEGQIENEAASLSLSAGGIDDFCMGVGVGVQSEECLDPGVPLPREDEPASQQLLVGKSRECGHEYCYKAVLKVEACSAAVSQKQCPEGQIPDNTWDIVKSKNYASCTPKSVKPTVCTCYINPDEVSCQPGT